MKQFILMLSILSLLLFGAWGCSENSEPNPLKKPLIKTLHKSATLSRQPRQGR